MIANAWKRANPEKHRTHQREWRARHPDKIAAYNAARRIGPVAIRCVECGGKFEGRPDRLVCGRRCKDARYRRLHPEAYREKQRRKAARRRWKVRNNTRWQETKQ